MFFGPKEFFVEAVEAFAAAVDFGFDVLFGQFFEDAFAGLVDNFFGLFVVRGGIFYQPLVVFWVKEGKSQVFELAFGLAHFQTVSQGGVDF